MREKISELEMLKRLKNKQSLEYARCSLEVGLAFGKLGDRNQEITYLKEAEKAFSSLNLGDHKETADCCKILVRLYASNEIKKQSKEKQTHFIECAKKAALVYSRLGNCEHDAIECLKELAFYYKKKYNYKQEINVLLDELKLHQKLNLNDKTSLADCLRKVGVCYGKNKNYKLQLEYCLKCLQVLNETNAADTCAMADALRDAGDAYCANSNKVMQNHCLIQAMRIYSRQTALDAERTKILKKLQREFKNFQNPQPIM